MLMQSAQKNPVNAVVPVNRPLFCEQRANPVDLVKPGSDVPCDPVGRKGSRKMQWMLDPIMWCLNS